MANKTDGERQLVVFELAGEVYGVDIRGVREIIRMQDMTRVPDAPRFIQGIINLRGKVIPVIDLRMRFGLQATERTQDTRILVVDAGSYDMGITVDAVREVLRISESCVEAASVAVTAGRTTYLEGIAKLSDRLVILLDLDRVLSDEEHNAVTAVEAAAA